MQNFGTLDPQVLTELMTKHQKWLSNVAAILDDKEQTPQGIRNAIQSAPHKDGRLLVKDALIDLSLLASLPEALRDFRASRFVNCKFIGRDGKKKILNNLLKFDYSIFEETCDFSNSIFFHKMSFVGSYFNSYCNFKDSTFYGECVFDDSHFRSGLSFRKSICEKYMHFNRVTFEGLAEFTYTEFKEDSDFIESKFINEATFVWTKFIGAARFQGSEFKSECRIRIAIFDSVANFGGVKFYGRCYFTETVFNGNALFNYVQFNSGGYFSKTKFYALTIFSDSNILSELWFNKSTLSGEIVFENTNYNDVKPEFKECSFKKANLKKMTVENGVFESTIFDKDCTFYDSINSARFYFCQFKNVNLSANSISHVDFGGSTIDVSSLNFLRKSGSIKNWLFANWLGTRPNLKGRFRFGINGLYNVETNSSLLLELEPRGDSMMGSDVSTVLDNLQVARRALSISLASSLLLIGFYINYAVNFDTAREEATKLWNKGINVNFIGVEFSGDVLLLVLTIVPILIMLLVGNFMNVARGCAKYLQARTDVMKMSAFPWLLSSYVFWPWAWCFPKNAKLEEDKRPSLLKWVGLFWNAALNMMGRIIYAFHPLVALLVVSNEFMNRHPLAFWSILAGTTLSCGWVFYTSIRYLQPILFDKKREERDKEIAASQKLNAFGTTF